MTQLFFDFWWLLFPLAFVLFGAWDRWLAYKRSRDHLELIKAYAAQGKDPPAELLEAARAAAEPPFIHPAAARRYYRGYDRWGAWSGGFGPWGPWSPYAAWRTAIMTGAVAAGFWVAARSNVLPGTEAPFRLVAIILTCVAAANLVIALMGTIFRPRNDVRPDEPK